MSALRDPPAVEVGAATGLGETEMPLTHQLFADAIGAARETVTVALRDLRREGVVTRHGRIYTLKVDPEELD